MFEIINKEEWYEKEKNFIYKLVSRRSRCERWRRWWYCWWLKELVPGFYFVVQIVENTQVIQCNLHHVQSEGSSSFASSSIKVKFGHKSISPGFESVVYFFNSRSYKELFWTIIPYRGKLKINIIKIWNTQIIQSMIN